MRGEPESSWGSEMSGSHINQTYRGARIRKLASHIADGGVPVGLAANHVWVRWPLYMLVELQVFKSPAKEELYLGPKKPYREGEVTVNTC